MIERKIDRGTGLFSTARQATRLLVVMLFIEFLTIPAARAGYLWGYQSKRIDDDLSAHVIQLGLSCNTKGKAAPYKPHIRDVFR